MMLFFVKRDFQYLTALCFTVFFGKLFTSGPHFMMIENMFDIRLFGYLPFSVIHNSPVSILKCGCPLSPLLLFSTAFRLSRSGI